ncbi:hypothetical protein HX875_17945 [Pseudomonas yamanorum]|jgi:hypothetical protein|uniref:Uncharacterized protein n=1 Tax=Pseudomonas yamanorum TaxID=515393 RepID=A0A7Y8EHJ9_9PSED|nr:MULTISPECIES: hypothetical protein [Pseudomonas]MCS3418532.1 hypothetical protein [Pseudomonas sp. BIGb0558]MCS3437898.1 hypothetical protein [Pseudomonas sp. BIGb0450]NVZ83503.1 hypothetical protein [Pseudomonas yamanorum]NWD23610.1 hypothetical protein [Pseudomonas yamanorum]NWE14798.1 hypothetical protein [Pseudomonas yamanorum]
MEPLIHAIIGEFWDKEFVEALVPGNGISLRVCIRVPSRANYSAYLQNADALLPALIADIGAVEAIATKAVGSDCPAKVFDVWIAPDGSASYTCGFFDGAMEDELVGVKRSQEGDLTT